MYSLYSLRAACRWWSVRSCCDKQELRYRACINLSRLRYGCQRWTLAVAQHCTSPTIQSTHGLSIFGKYLNANLKFALYGCTHVCIQTHLHNAVPLVWGSLRLAPITVLKCWLKLQIWRRTWFNNYQLHNIWLYRVFLSLQVVWRLSSLSFCTAEEQMCTCTRTSMVFRFHQYDGNSQSQRQSQLYGNVLAYKFFNYM